MKWNLSWLMQHPDFTFDETVAFPKESYRNVSGLRDLSEIAVSGTGSYREKENRLYVDLKISGQMVLACAISNEDVDYPFSAQSTEIFAFDKPAEDEDVHEVKKDTAELAPIVFQNVILEVPLRVVKDGATMKREGKGWRVVDENDEPGVDPRLAKLKDYFKSSDEREV